MIQSKPLAFEKPPVSDRQHFIGGSDARIIMGGDEDALIRLWQEKRGETEPVDLSGELVVQLGRVSVFNSSRKAAPRSAASFAAINLDRGSFC